MDVKGESKYPVYIDEDVMSPKAHGTCEKPVMKNLRWNCDYETADRISCFNRHYAEHSGYWQSTSFLQEVRVYSFSELFSQFITINIFRRRIRTRKSRSTIL